MLENGGGEPAGARGPVVISVCVTCRGADDASPERPGETLLCALSDLMPDDGSIVARPVQCLSVCKRPCSAAFTGPDRYSYVFGDLDPATGAAALLEGARTYAATEHGYMLWRERPEPLRRGIVARLPPLGWDPPDGRHPR